MTHCSVSHECPIDLLKQLGESPPKPGVIVGHFMPVGGVQLQTLYMYVQGRKDSEDPSSIQLIIKKLKGEYHFSG